MKVFSWQDVLNSKTNNSFLEDFSKGTAVSVGSFDGVHKGHRLILSKLIQYSKERNLKSGVVTFERPLPSFKKGSDYEGDVSSLNQRLNILEDLGIDFVILVNFNDEFSRLSGTDFFEIIKTTCNLKYVVEGEDFRCGFKGATDSKVLKNWAVEQGIQIDFVPPIFFEFEGHKERISSSIIRKMIMENKMQYVEEVLLRPYKIDCDKDSTQVKPGKN